MGGDHVALEGEVVRRLLVEEVREDLLELGGELRRVGEGGGSLEVEPNHRVAFGGH